MRFAVLDVLSSLWDVCRVFDHLVGLAAFRVLFLMFLINNNSSHYFKMKLRHVFIL